MANSEKNRPLTPNYAFVLYANGDWAQLLSIYNVAITQIDAALRRIENKVQSNETRIIELENRLDSLEQTVENHYQEFQEFKAETNQRFEDFQQYVDNKFEEVNNTINEIKAGGLQDIVNKFYGGGTVNEDYTITWGDPGKAAVGTFNWFSGASNEYYIRTRCDGDGDMRGQ